MKISHLLYSLVLSAVLFSPVIAETPANPPKNQESRLFQENAYNDIAHLFKKHKDRTTQTLKRLMRENEITHQKQSVYGEIVLSAHDILESLFVHRPEDKAMYYTAWKGFLSNPQTLNFVCDVFCQSIANYSDEGVWQYHVKNRFQELQKLFALAGQDDFVPTIQKFLKFENDIVASNSENGGVQWIANRWDSWRQSDNNLPKWVEVDKPEPLLAAYRHFTRKRADWELLFARVEKLLPQ